MLVLIVLGIFILSFILAVFSLRDYKGNREVRKIKEELSKEKIKGVIMFDKENEPKHYSSYSS
jgi:hypothetical protein